MRILQILLLLSLWLPAAVSAHTAANVQITCPVCSTRFQTLETMSSTTMGSMRDFEKTGAVGTMYEDAVACCPTCHYSAFTDDFAKPVTPELKTWVLATLGPRSSKRAFSKLEVFNVVAEVAVQEHRSEEQLALIYRLASYVCRHSATPEAERKALQAKVALHLERALAKGEVKESQVASVDYLIAEMDRRQGKFAEALTWFDKAASAKAPGGNFATWLTEQRALADKKDARNNI